MAGGKFKVLGDGVLGLPAYLWCRQAEHALYWPTACLVISRLASNIQTKSKGGQFSVVARGHFSVAIYTALLSGLTVEYYFVDKGVLRYDWPDWMKNFSIALDVTHNQLAFGHQTTNFICQDPDWGTLSLPEFNGYVLTFSLLFKYRFPLIKQPDFPDGRLFLYVGVGPGISYSYLEANNNIVGNDSAVGHGTATSPTLVAESGISLFVVKDVSIDLFFRYRYSAPRYEFNVGVCGAPLYVNFDNNSYNAALRIAYHF